MTMTITNVIAAICDLAADAGRLAGDFDHHIRHERDPVVHAACHRLRGACLELERYTRLARERLAETSKQKAALGLHAVEGMLRTVAADADGPNRAVLDRSIDRIKTARAAIS